MNLSRKQWQSVLGYAHECKDELIDSIGYEEWAKLVAWCEANLE